MTKASDNVFPRLLVSEGGSTATPAAGRVTQYAKADGLFYSKDDAGTETLMSGGSAGIPATLLDVKGDLIAASAADTAARLAAAANGASLITASGEATGLKWRLNNDGAAVAPAVTDDSGDGYSIGSRWLDTTADKEYVATDVSVGAAVWKETTAAGGSGALVFLEAKTASASATLDFTTFISSTYDTYVFKFVNVLPATSTAVLQMRIGTGGGPTYDAGTNYGTQIFRHSHNASAASGADSGATSIALTTAWLSTGVHAIGGSLELYDPQSTSFNKFVSGKFVYPDSGISNMVASEMVGQWNDSATAATAVRFLMSSGNITSGVIRVYGIAKA